MDAKRIRYNRITIDEKMLCIPLDHGYTNGPFDNLGNFVSLVSEIVEGGASSIIVHKGMVNYLPNLKNTGLIIHLSGSTEFNNEVDKRIVCSVLEAVQYGADAVSVHINVGNDFEQHMLQDAANISFQCKKYGMPLLAMMYVRNNDNITSLDMHHIMHTVRIATELGADIVKIPFPNDEIALQYIVKNSLVPIVVAGGGEILGDEELRSKTKLIMENGAKGVCYGRNIIKSQNPRHTISLLKSTLIT